jgi:hypothetical protein
VTDVSDRVVIPPAVQAPTASAAQPFAFFNFIDHSGLDTGKFVRALVAEGFIERDPPTALLTLLSGTYYEAEDVWAAIQPTSAPDSLALLVGTRARPSLKSAAQVGPDVVQRVAKVYQTTRRRFYWQIEWKGELYLGGETVGIVFQKRSILREFWRSLTSFGAQEKLASALAAAGVAVLKSGLPFGLHTLAWLAGGGGAVWVIYSLTSAVAESRRNSWHLDGWGKS